MDAVVGGERGGWSSRGNVDNNASGKVIKAPLDGDRRAWGYRRVLGRRVGGASGVVDFGLYIEPTVV